MNLSILFIILIVISLLFCILAAYFDFKKGIIPNTLNFYFLLCGLLINWVFTVFLLDIRFILASIICGILTFLLSFIMWKLNIWGGGDVKLLTAIATAIPSNQNFQIFLNFTPKLSIYPFSFSVILNSIFISFPMLLFFLFYLNYKNKVFKLNKDSIFFLLNLKNFNFFLKNNFNKIISINDLEEGMFVNRYYFNNFKVFYAIEHSTGNLKVHKLDDNSKFLFYFSSDTMGGITKEDCNILKILKLENAISDKISIKIGFPFAPSIAIGFLIGILFGDLFIILLNGGIL